MLLLLPELIAFLVEMVSALTAVIARVAAKKWVQWLASSLVFIFKEKIKVWLKKQVNKITAYAISKFGIDLAVDDEGDFIITEDGITQAANKLFDTKFTNIFNRELLKADIERIGMDRLNQALGAAPDKPIITSLRDQDLIRQRLHGFIGEQVKISLNGGTSTLIDSASRERIIAAALAFEAKYDKIKPQAKQPLIMTKAAISNRARQARYRAKHKRVWVEK